MSHTPGPWEVAKDYLGDLTDVVSMAAHTKRRAVATMNGAAIRMAEVIAERKANARLIAAAPDLLDALRMADDYFRDSRLRADEYDAMREFVARAIAKAEGRVEVQS